jgi:hypothetical protein
MKFTGSSLKIALCLILVLSLLGTLVAVNYMDSGGDSSEVDNEPDSNSTEPQTPTETPSNATVVEPVNPPLNNGSNSSNNGNGEESEEPIEPANTTDQTADDTPDQIPDDIPDNTTEQIIPPTNTTEPHLEGLAGQLYNQSSLFREVYSNQEIRDNILAVAAVNGSDVPRNLAYQILEQIQNDGRVIDKVNLTREVFELYVAAGFAKDIQQMSQIYTVNNGTEYFKSSETLMSEIGKEALITALEKLGQNNGINIDFNNARKHASLLRLARYTPPILGYPKDWREGVIQVDEIVYKHGFDQVNGEVYVWTNFIKPAVDFIMGQRANGVITAPDGEIDLIHANLLQVDIKTGEYTEIGREPDSMCLGVGVKNVNPDSTGESPLKWLYELAHEHYTNRTKTIDWLQQKWSPFDIAMYWAYRRADGLANNWPNCTIRYKADLDAIRATSGDLIPFLIGEPILLRGYYPNKIVPNMIEQVIPHYTTIIAHTFGIKSRVNGAIYPGGTAYHDEPAFKLNGRWFSYFYGNDNHNAFKKDYEGVPTEPHLTITDTSGKYVDVIL